MRFIKKSARKKPKVSLVLLDWSVRESFHLMHYLSKQTVDRSQFEVIIIEYYSRVSDAIRQFEEQVDAWIVMDMPESCYYHKHLMYNIGIVAAHGDIVMIGDSDAMVKETFIHSIIQNFKKNRKLAYHMDEFRNMRRDMHPFNYPDFSEILGEGCANNVDGRTAGVLNTDDPIHSRNYGACMCAMREDLIAIGGADEHLDYLGHICGPYDMTFRLVNYGHTELWDMNEFLYHTWHPGQAGADNYMGPHDGRHMSSTALEAIDSRRVLPLLENRAIHLLRSGKVENAEAVLDQLINPDYLDEWNIARLEQQGNVTQWSDYKRDFGVYKGFRLVAEVDRVLAYPLTDEGVLTRSGQGYASVFEGLDIEEIKCKIDNAIPLFFQIFFHGVSQDMIVTLFNVKKWGNFDKVDGSLKVAIDNQWMAYYLRVMSTFHMIPDSDVRRVCNASDMEGVLNKIKESGRMHFFFVEQTLFQDHHALISAHDVPGNNIVVV